MLVLYASLVNFVATTVFVDSKLFLPWRQWWFDRMWHCDFRGKRYRCGGKPFFFPEDATEEEANASQPYMRNPWKKVTQLITCQLCVRTWIGFALAAYLGGPLGGSFSVVANGLLYAAGGHLVYSAEAVSEAARHKLDPVVPQQGVDSTA